MQDDYRYHAGATQVLMAGIISGVVGVSLALAPPWLSFAAGAVPVFLAIAAQLSRE